MGRYVIRRLLQFIPTVFGSLFLLHYLTTLGIQFSGDPVRALFGDRTPSPEQLEQMRRALGMDDPCLRREGDPCLGLFVDRLGDMATGDFGQDLRERPVMIFGGGWGDSIVGHALPFTLKLVVIAIIVDILIGVSAGILAGLRSGSVFDYMVKIGTVLTISVPTFIVYLSSQIFVSVKLGGVLKGQGWPEWITHGLLSPSYNNAYPWFSVVLPGIWIGSFYVATTSRLTRTSLLENLRADYVRTAKAKGLARSRVVGVHTLRNSLVPVVTNLGLDLGVMMSGAIVAETVFNIPGLGGTIGRSITRGEPMVIIGIATILVLVYLVANLVVDLLYAVLDPRIRYE